MYTTNQQSELSDLDRFVLIVDDEPVLLDMAARMLHHLGCNVLTAGSGTEAIAICEQISRQEHARAKVLALVILDMAMPAMDGAEVGRHIKTVSPNVPIVFSSGYRFEQVRNKVQIDKIDAFLQKPYTLADLQQLLLKTVNTAQEVRQC